MWKDFFPPFIQVDKHCVMFHIVHIVNNLQYTAHVTSTHNKDSTSSTVLARI